MAEDDLLGAGTNTVHVASRDGKTIHFQIPAQRIDWGRTLCGVSKTEVVIDPARCLPALADVHPWAHSLVVYRDDERVWEGPFRKRRDTKEGLVLVASDVLGWTEARKIETARTSLGGKVRDHLEWAVRQALLRDDPNIVPFLQVLGGPIPTRTADLTVTSTEKMYSSVLTDMTGNGGRWTALGRSIILWDDAAVIGRLRDLSPENHLLDDVEVIEDGDLLATEAWARNDQGVVGSATVPGVVPVHPFYGLVQRITPSGATTPAGVRATAQALANSSYPTPITIEVPSAAALRCSAPFPIHRLVPGVLVPVTTVTATSRTVTGTFVLSEVRVTQVAGADERVTISLSPLSEAA